MLNLCFWKDGRKNGILELEPAYRQAVTIPVPNEKFVTNYILEHYHYFLDRTDVILT